MHFSRSSLLIAAVAPLADAFPRAMYEAAAADPSLRVRAEEIRKREDGYAPAPPGSAAAAENQFETVPIFNAKAQYIDVSKGSGHEFVPPSGDDLRGPCPGLNAFANHNFLPHNGYATIEQYIEATSKVVGMGDDLALFLSVLGGVLDGDALAWSMGGTPTPAQGGPTGPLGHGLVGSHNKYEGDASPTRPDLYEAGNDYECVTSQFQDMVNYSPGGEITMDSLTTYRSDRNDVQIANNPYYFYGPFSGIAVQPAAYTFIYRYMANHSAEFPRGKLTYDVAASWFGVEGTNGNYKAVQGHERIPNNWYRRALEYPYGLQYFIADLGTAVGLHPKFFAVGGNTGTTNSFTGINLGNFTGGLYNLDTLAEGNNLACYIYQLSAQAKPDALLPAINTLTNTLGKLSADAGCAQLQAIDNSQLEKFPGYQFNPVYRQ